MNNDVVETLELQHPGHSDENSDSALRGGRVAEVRDDSFDLMLNRWFFRVGESIDDDHVDRDPLLTGTLELRGGSQASVGHHTVGAWTSLGGFPTSFGTSSTPINKLRNIVKRIHERLELDGEKAFERYGKTPVVEEPSAHDEKTSIVDAFVSVIGQPDDVSILERNLEVTTERWMSLARMRNRRGNWTLASALLFFEEVYGRWDDITDAAVKVDQTWKQERVYPTENSIIGSTLNSIARIFGAGVDYLGPLRQGPKPLYSYGERGASTELGQGGEYFAYYLSRYRDSQVEPGLSGSTSQRSATLVQAMSNWASKLGVAQRVEVKEVPGTGRRVEVQMPGVPEPMTWDKVGIGVSQVLPVLLKVLSSSPRSVVLLEQPELHLHPDSQAELAEFLLQASRTGRQIVVETHSDTFLTRLRRLVAEGTLQSDDSVKNSIAFVFAHRDPETGVTEFENVDLDPTGTFPYWPEGFADKATEEAKKLLEVRLEVLERDQDKER